MLGKPTSSHDLNTGKIRNLQIQCSVDRKLIDRIGQTFGTTDPAHHAPYDYMPSRQRIQQYLGYLNEFYQVLKNAKSAASIAPLLPSKAHPMKRTYPVQPDVLDSVSNATATTVASSISPLTQGA